MTINSPSPPQILKFFSILWSMCWIHYSESFCHYMKLSKKMVIFAVIVFTIFKLHRTNMQLYKQIMRKMCILFWILQPCVALFLWTMKVVTCGSFQLCILWLIHFSSFVMCFSVVWIHPYPFCQTSSSFSCCFFRLLWA